MLKLYTCFKQIEGVNREYLIDILKPFTKGGAERLAYGDFVNRITFVDKPEEADIGVLPLATNYYMAGGRNLANRFVERCKKAGKNVLCFSFGDFAMRLWRDDIIHLQASGYQSSRLVNQHAQPVFIRDPIHEHFGDQMTIRNHSEKAFVGFCGHCVCSPLKACKEIAQIGYRNGCRFLGLTLEEPQPMYPPTLRRAKALNYLEKNDSVHSHFIRREGYRAGVSSDEDRARTTREFFENVKNTEYTVCMRGGGNFSVRLYETLAMGRIPVFINTDCILPFDQWIPWKEHVVWVEDRELPYIGEKVANFHSELDSASFEDLQRKNRRLWEEWLSFAGFHDKLLEHAESIIL